MNLIAILSIIASLSCLLLGNYVYYKNTRSHLNRVFMLLCLVAAFWSFCEYGFRQTDKYEIALFWIRVSAVWAFLPALVLHYILLLIEKSEFTKSKYFYLLVYLPAVGFFLLDLTTDLLGGTPAKVSWGWTYTIPDNKIILALGIIWSFGIIFLAIILGFTYYTKLTTTVQRRQTQYVLIGLASPLFIGALTELLLPLFEVNVPDCTTPALILGCISVAYGVWKYRLFVLTPEIASNDIIAEMSNFLILIDQNGKITTVNQATLNLLGYPEKELLNHSFKIIFTDPAIIYELSQKATLTMVNPVHNIENVPTTLKSKTLLTIPVLISASLVYNQDRSQFGIVVVGSHLTQKRLVELKLKESEEKYRDLFENANDLIQSVYSDGRFQYVNRAWRETLGYNDEDIHYLNFFDIIHPSYQEKSRQLFEQLINGDKVSNIETVFVAKDGREIMVEGSADCKFLNGKLHVTRAIFRDITERRQIEAALLEHKRRYDLATSAGKVGVWEWDLMTQTMYLDPKLKKMLGYSDHEIQNQYNHWYQLIYPADRAKTMQAVKDYQNGRTAQFEVEHRMLHKDGSIRWMLARGSTCNAQPSDRNQIIGTSTDITALKQAEQALHEAHEKLEKRVAERTAELVQSNQLLRTEIAERKAAEIKMQSYLNDLNFLEQAAIRFSELSPDEDIYQLIAQQLKKLTGRAIIFINSYDKITNTLSIRAIQGLGKFEDFIVKTLGRHPIGMSFTMNNEAAREGIGSGKLVKVPGGLFELSFGQVPKALCELFEKTLGLGELYTMGFTRQREIFGNGVIVTRSVDDIKNPGIIETFINHASVALQRKRGEEQINASLLEKEILLREIHHRVKNNLQVISSLIFLQSKKIKDAKAIELFKETQNRVRSMALIHEALYNAKDFAHINIEEYIRNLTNHLFRLYEVKNRVIRLKINMRNISLSIDTAVACGMIINELVSNSLKYAFPVQAEGSIRIELSSTSNNSYKLIVGDDGIGFQEKIDLEQPMTLGLQIVNTLVDQLKGSMKIELRQGVLYEISFRDIK